MTAVSGFLFVPVIHLKAFLFKTDLATKTKCRIINTRNRQIRSTMRKRKKLTVFGRIHEHQAVILMSR